MKTLAYPILLALVLLMEAFLSRAGFGQDRIRIGVPLFPTVSYPVFIANERGSLTKTVSEPKSSGSTASPRPTRR
jgi:hypothetical protein